MQRIDIHDYPRRLAASLALIDKSDLSAENKRLLHEFARKLQVEGLSPPRIEKYTGTLRMIALALKKDFRAATRQDLEDFMCALRARQDRSIWTKTDYAITLHRFYRWLEGGDEKLPDKVSGISTTIRKADQPRVKKSELITEEEVHQLLEAAECPRDRALIAMIWDTGGRVGEVGGLTISDCTFSDQETMIDLQGKTGARTVLAIECTPHVLNWLQNHPNKEDPRAPLWVNIGQVESHRGRALAYRAIYALFKRAFGKAGIRKKFNPHLFRHSRATWCVEHGWSTYELCKHFGWELDSGMPAVYLSLSDGMVHNKMRSSYGLAKEEFRAAPVLSRCARCSAANPRDAKRCARCGFTLGSAPAYAEISGREKAETQLAMLLRDPRVAELFTRVLAEASSDAQSLAPVHAGGRPGSAPLPLPPILETVRATLEGGPVPVSVPRDVRLASSRVLQGPVRAMKDREEELV